MGRLSEIPDLPANLSDLCGDHAAGDQRRFRLHAVQCPQNGTGTVRVGGQRGFFRPRDETADTITAAEYSDNGYSRYRVLPGQEASGLKAGMPVYTRDVSLRSRSAGKVSFLIDLTPFLDTFFHEKSDGAVYYFTGDRVSMELQSQIDHWLENR